MGRGAARGNGGGGGGGGAVQCSDLSMSEGGAV